MRTARIHDMPMMQKLLCMPDLDRFAELSEELGAAQHVLVADVHCQPDNVDEVALHHPHALQDARCCTLRAWNCLASSRTISQTKFWMQCLHAHNCRGLCVRPHAIDTGFSRSALVSSEPRWCCCRHRCRRPSCPLSAAASLSTLPACKTQRSSRRQLDDPWCPARQTCANPQRRRRKYAGLWPSCAGPAR
jgi:hypothetical protein